MSTSRWIATVIIVIIILAGVQWYLNSRPSAYFNQYGNDASSTPATPTGQGAAAINAAAPAPSSGVSPSPAPSATNSSVKNFMHTVTIQTTKGTIVFETYDADAPNTVKNFITLANKGFYNGLIFHRVINGFMIQGGDPTGTGSGGPGYKFADELDPNTPSSQAGYVRGTVAMANSGPDTNGSQFFIMQKDTPLPHSYTIFGKVISGMDAVDAIASVPVDSPTHNMPLTPVKMTKVTVAAK